MNLVLMVSLLVQTMAFQGKGTPVAEPALQGKTLSQWLEMLGQNGSPPSDMTMRSKRGALIALELMSSSTDPRILDAISKALQNDRDARIREACASAMVRIATKISDKSKSETPREFAAIALNQSLKQDKEVKVREGAAQGLAKLAPQSLVALETLAQALSEKEPGIRMASADALRRLGKAAKGASKPLQNLASNKDADNISRSFACLALGNMQEESAIPVFLAILESKAEALDLQVASAKAISTVPLEDKDTIVRIGKVLGGPNAPRELKLAVVVCLDQLGPVAAPAGEALIGVLGDRDAAIRAIALHALGNIGKDLGALVERARNAIATSLNDVSLDVRLSALETLGRWGPELVDSSIISRVEKLEKDPAREVRETVKIVLARLRGAQK